MDPAIRSYLIQPLLIDLFQCHSLGEDTEQRLCHIHTVPITAGQFCRDWSLRMLQLSSFSASPRNALYTAHVPAPAPAGAYPSSSSTASFFARWKAATADCRAGSKSSAPSAPPAAVGRSLCRYEPHGPFHMMSEALCLYEYNPLYIGQNEINANNLFCYFKFDCFFEIKRV